MKKLLSVALSLVMMLTVMTALPFDAFAKANPGDIYYGVNFYIDGNLEAGKRPSLVGTGSEYSKINLRCSSGTVRGASVSVKDSSGNSVSSNPLNAAMPYYELTYTMNLFDTDGVFRCFDVKYLNVYVNNVKIMTTTGNVTTYNSNGYDNGGLKIVVKYYNLANNSGDSLGFYSSYQNITITAPEVAGKHFTKWTAENGNHQAPVFGDANSATTTIRTEPAKTTVTPNYEDHTYNSGVVTKEATTAQAGIRTYTCTVCGQTKTESIPKLKSGWIKENGKWYYYVNNAAVKWRQKIGGKYYYFNGAGVMQSGWIKGGTWMYAASDGALKTGWQKIGGKWYWFTSEGSMVTGWQKISGKWYYFNASGAMVSGWQKISGKWYYFNSSGAMLTGWQKISNKWYYFNSDGSMVTGWKKISGYWYYFNSSGTMLTGTQRIDNKNYTFDSSGRMKTTSSSTSSSSHKIYVTKTGKKYHYDSHCNGGTYYESTLENALRLGLTPCDKCVNN